MDFSLSQEEQAFRDEVRSFLKEQLPVKDMGQWTRAVREKRWIGFSWPKDVGGGGGGLMEQAILKEEMRKAKAPPLGSDMMGLAWVGPALIAYGTEEQKAKYIPEILDSKTVWCTGYSEPDIGSDLAALQCKGVRDGDDYVINGQKIWTTLAPWAKRIILLVRTSSHKGDKHRGITCVLVDMKAKGLEVRPIKNMSGTSIFAEIFFTDVRVPISERLGDEDRGWQVTLTALANERSGISEVEALVRRLERLKDLARSVRMGGRSAAEDPQVRQRIARHETRLEGMRLNGLRFLSKQLRGEPLSSETSINKFHRSDLEIEMAETALELMGSASPYMKGSGAVVDEGFWQNSSLNWPEVVIGGGTPNIQKNIIAERILGLPKDGTGFSER